MAVVEVHIGHRFGIGNRKFDQVSTAMEAQAHGLALTLAITFHFHECKHDPSERTYILSQCAASIISLARLIKLFGGSMRLIKPTIPVEVDDKAEYYNSIECISERLSSVTAFFGSVAAGKNVSTVDKDTKREIITVFLDEIRDVCMVAAKLGVDDLTPYIEEWLMGAT